jgi:hypothetical protein
VHEWAPEATAAAESLSTKVSEQQQQMVDATEANVAQKLGLWEERLAAAKDCAKQQQALADSALAAEREKSRSLAAELEKSRALATKHQSTIHALTSHHRAELSRVQDILIDSHAKELSTQTRSFQSELSNVSYSSQVAAVGGSLGVFR